MKYSHADEIASLFERKFGAPPEALVRAPGRVDLMGSHTDYNEGFVLAVAVNRDVLAAGSLRDDRQVRVYSRNFEETVSFALDPIERDNVHTWTNYVRGMLHFLSDAGVELRGMDIAIDGRVPLGSGLSSSAAIEMATGCLAQRLLGFQLSGPEMALIGQKAENRFVGVNTGIMDQFMSRLAAQNHALFLDCRTLDYENIPLNTTDIKVVVCNTMKPRGLVDSEYGLRRSQCEEAARILAQWIPGVTALRDVSEEDFHTHQHKLPDVVRRRAEHIITENNRTYASRSYLARDDFDGFAHLMNESYRTSRDLYEISCPELDTMVEVSLNAPGGLSSRISGAGFGGCTVGLVWNKEVDAFVDYVTVQYARRTGLHPIIYVCTAENGAESVSLP